MCMLTYIPADTTPDYDALRAGAIINNDGHGYAIVAGSRIIRGRFMSSKAAIGSFMRARAQWRGPALFHSRFATDGAVNVKNVHPFRVGNDARTVVGHNGIIPRCLPRKGDSRSDTRILADHHLRGRNFDKPRSIFRLEDFIGRGSKLVILTVDPQYKHNAYIINQDLGHWHEGIWYSNHDYVRSVQWLGNGNDVPESGLAWCGNCTLTGAYHDIFDPWGLCRFCKHCEQCESHVEECICYVPAAMEKT